MQIEYEISEKDFINAQRLAIKNSPNRAVRRTRLYMPLFGLGLLVFVAYSTFQQGLSWRVVPALAICLFFISIPFLTRRTQKKMYAKNSAMHGRLSLDMSESGLHFQGASFSSQTGWSNFSKFFEDDQSFVLYQNSQVFNMVPKRTLTPEQIAALRECLKRNIR